VDKQHDRLKRKEREILLTIATNPTSVIVDMLKAFIVRVTIVNSSPLQMTGSTRRFIPPTEQNKEATVTVVVVLCLLEQHDED
jgi:hypothetical protein